jgi:hypothetical protein
MAKDQPGPFDRILKTDDAGPPEHDPAVKYIGGLILGLALLLLILVLPPISVLSRGGGDGPGGPATGEAYSSTVRSSMPRLPAGLVAASPMFDLVRPEGASGPVALQVPLREDERGETEFALYTYEDGRWQRVAEAVPVLGGTAARAELSELPSNVAVLRRGASLIQVAGTIPAGTEINERAASLITMLSPVVFIPNADGGLIGEPPLVPPASYTLMPGLVALDPGVVDDILRSSDLRARHAAEIAAAVTAGNYAGINVDYRGVSDTLKEQYTDFARQVSDGLRADGRTFVLTLPMPVRDGSAMREGAYDWEALGGFADTIVLAGELDQELYFQATEAALDYVTERIDRNKLLLTISSQSVERGGDGLHTIPFDEALGIASVIATDIDGDVTPGAQVRLVARNLAEAEGGTGLRWNDTARAVTFQYPGLAGRRTVWIGNQFSATFRLELARRYSLGGVMLTDVSQQGGGADVWAAVGDFYDAGEVSLSTPNGELLVPSWEAEGGTLSSTTGDTVTWTAPSEPGSYSVTLIVSDGVVRAGQRVTIEVVAPGAE